MGLRLIGHVFLQTGSGHHHPTIATQVILVFAEIHYFCLQQCIAFTMGAIVTGTANKTEYKATKIAVK